MRTPPYLKSGDKVAIVAPARKVSPLEMDFAISTIQSWGLQVVTGNHLFGSFNQFSGTDEERTEDFQAMLDNPEVKAIFCARGGYGTVRIIDRLNFSFFEQHPKWIIGYSDITVLHSHIHSHFGIETIHALMPINFADADNKEALLALKKALFGESLQYTIPSHALNSTGSATGTLTGGNLSILYALSGTASELQADEKILFIEDLDEYLYHIDRMMQNLKRSGKLNQIKAIVVGGMTKMNDNAIAFGKTAEQIVAEYAHEAGIPICFGFPAGHLNDNRALIMGREIQLNIQSDFVTLNFLDSSESVGGESTFKKILKPALYFLGLLAIIYSAIYLIGRFFK